MKFAIRKGCSSYDSTSAMRDDVKWNRLIVKRLKKGPQIPPALSMELVQERYVQSTVRYPSCCNRQLRSRMQYECAANP